MMKIKPESSSPLFAQNNRNRRKENPTLSWEIPTLSEKMKETLTELINGASLNNTCACCEKPMNKCEKSTTVQSRYIYRNLSLTVEGMNLLRDLNLQTLLQRKKLELVLDLDNTLIHAISADILKSARKGKDHNDEDVYEILNGETVVKLRPGARDFLENVSKLFVLSIFTMADEPYAREIAKILESENVQFSRVISREEDCSKMYKKSLDRLWSHQQVVLIVDDLDQIWKQEDKGNLIKIEPYTYFHARGSGSDDDHELARVWGVLKAVHSSFYDKSAAAAANDVRPLLEKVKMTMWLDSRACNSSKHQEIRSFGSM